MEHLLSDRSRPPTPAALGQPGIAAPLTIGHASVLPVFETVRAPLALFVPALSELTSPRFPSDGMGDLSSAQSAQASGHPSIDEEGQAPDFHDVPGGQPPGLDLASRSINTESRAKRTDPCGRTPANVSTKGHVGGNQSGRPLGQQAVEVELDNYRAFEGRLGDFFVPREVLFCNQVVGCTPTPHFGSQHRGETPQDVMERFWHETLASRHPS